MGKKYTTDQIEVGGHMLDASMMGSLNTVVTNSSSYMTTLPSHNHDILYHNSTNSIDISDHSGHTWLRNLGGRWTFQSGSSGDDWTQSFSHYLPAAGSSANAVWMELGQRTSNASDGRYKGVRIVKYSGSSVVDGDLQAGDLTVVGEIQLNNSETVIKEASGNAVRIQTTTGYIDIGSKNSGFIHFEGNRPYYMGNTVIVDGILKPYTSNVRDLGASSNRWKVIYGEELNVWSSVKASIFYDYDNTGYYLNPASTSNLNGLNAVNVTLTGDLQVDGQITQAGVVDRVSWGRTYSASNTTIATLVTNDGGALPTGGAYRVTGHISGTGTDQVSMAVFWNEDGTWYCNNTFAGGTSSNHIEFLISDSVPKVKTWHSSNYSIHVAHERLSLDETGTDNLRGYFGSDSFLKWTESTNSLVVPGTISATSGNSTEWNTAYGWGDHAGLYAAANHTHSYLPLSGGTLTGTLAANGGIHMGNTNLTNVNHITINDPGSGEGIEWLGGNGWKIFESSDSNSNGAGNLQFSVGSVHKFRVDTSGHTTSMGSSRAPIFYDSNNTNYYLNPAGTSRLGYAHFDGYDDTSGNARTSTGVSLGRYTSAFAHIDIASSNSNGGWLDFSDASGGDYGGRIRYHNGSDYMSFYAGGSNEEFRINSSYTTSLGSSRAPVFYDSDNTGYYVNPASYSKLNAIIDERDNLVVNRRQSGSDFVDGTLVTTTIDASATNGSSYIIEVTGKSYSSVNAPFSWIGQGYLYNDTIIADSAISQTGIAPDYMKVFKHSDNKLAFWWPRYSYWNSFEVRVRKAGSHNENKNYVSGITNSTEPSSDKKVQTDIVKVWTRNSLQNLSQLTNDSNYLTTSGKAADSNLLDGINSTQFLRSDISDETSSGVKTWFGTALDTGSSARIQVNGFQRTGNIYLHSGGNAPDNVRNSDYLGNSNGDLYWNKNGVGNGRVYTSLDFTNNSGNWNTAYTHSQSTHAPSNAEANVYSTPAELLTAIKTVDGSGSGLDADKLDGYNSAQSGNNIILRTASNGYLYNNNWIHPANSTGLFYDAGVHFHETGNYMYSSTSLQAANDMRAPIFYDRNNTSYYLDPASTSNLNSVTLSGRLNLDLATDYDSTVVTSLTTAPLQVADVNVGTTDTYLPLAHMSARYTSGYRTHMNIGLKKAPSAWGDTQTGMYVALGGNDSYPTRNWLFSYGGYIKSGVDGVHATDSFRAPIFYDSNDTSYYVNPASTSKMHAIWTVGSGANSGPRWDTSFHVVQSQHWYGHSGSQTMYLGESGNPVRLRGSLRIGSNADADSGMALTVNGSANATSSFRAPIFYDSDNTGYYVDPASTSSMYRLELNNHIDMRAQTSTWIEADVMADAIGWNTSYGVYIGSNIGGTHYLRGNGTFTTNGSTYNLYHTGNLALATLGYTGATNANYITNNNQLTNGAGYTTYIANQNVNTTDSPTFVNQYIGNAIYHSGDTNTYMQFHASDQWRVVTNGTERLEVNNTQVTVANNLQVGGSIYASQYIYHTGDTNTYMRFPSNDTISWNTAGSERMRINSSGNIGIGTTAPSYKLHVAGNTYANGSTIGSSDLWLRDQSSAYSTELKMQNNTHTIGIDYQNNETLRFITRSGVTTVPITFAMRTGTINAATFTQTSDERLKTKIADLSCDNIDVSWKSFEMKDNEGEYRTGVVAQELEQKHPEFVNTNDEGFKSVKYIDLLIAKIAELEARLEKLEK